jgi:hypothetical protein
MNTKKDVVVCCTFVVTRKKVLVSIKSFLVVEFSRLELLLLQFPVTQKNKSIVEHNRAFVLKSTGRRRDSSGAAQSGPDHVSYYMSIEEDTF